MLSITPVTITTDNVTAELLNSANIWGVTADTLDFDLIRYDTYWKLDTDEEDDEWRLLKGNDLLEKVTESEVRSPLFEIRQEYTIRLRQAEPHLYMDLRLAIATDKTKSKAVAIIDPSSKIPLKKGVQEWIKEAILRKQLRHNLLIGLYDTNLDKEINRFLAKLQKEGALQEPYRLPIGEFFPPVEPINDAVLLHYKRLNKERNLIEGVQPGDLIVEYVFPKEGRDGRRCNGHHVPVSEAVTKYAGYVTIDEETMYAEEDTDSIRFFAKVSGYVERQKGTFAIRQELQIEAADFRKTGSIETGIDRDVHVKIKRQEHTKDAVGTGVNIDVQKLDIKGTVGDNTKIQACEVTIGAQTHRRSNINVTEIANIHLHRGNLKAKEANIDVLEAGKVEAETVRVKKMIGGEIIAHEVYVDLLYSNAKITALSSIELQAIEGEQNKLIIDPHAVESYHEKIEALKMEIRDKTSRLQQQTKDLTNRQISFKEKAKRVKLFQQRILEAQKNGTEPLKADIVRIQQYKTEANELREDEEKLREEDLHLNSLQAELSRLYEADIHAVITHHGTYDGNTRVIFVDSKTREEYAVSPEGKFTAITLRLEGEEKKIILDA